MLKKSSHFWYISGIVAGREKETLNLDMTGAEDGHEDKTRRIP
jgi:hypothetical protein